MLPRPIFIIPSQSVQIHSKSVSQPITYPQDKIKIQHSANKIQNTPPASGN